MSYHYYSSMNGIVQVFVLVSLSATRDGIYIAHPEIFGGMNISF